MAQNLQKMPFSLVHETELKITTYKKLEKLKKKMKQMIQINNIHSGNVWRERETKRTEKR